MLKKIFSRRQCQFFEPIFVRFAEKQTFFGAFPIFCAEYAPQTLDMLFSAIHSHAEQKKKSSLP